MNTFIGTVLGAVAGFHIMAAAAQQPANPIDAHLTAAKSAAEFDFTGRLARLCIMPQTGPGRDVAPGPAPDRASVG